MSELTKYDIEVLEMLDGKRQGEWGAWVSECLEELLGRGLCTPGPSYQITDAGRRVLGEASRGERGHHLMSEIAEEMLEAARMAWRRGCNYSDDERIADGPIIIEVARAILAERERCAEIADEEDKMMTSAASSQPENSLARDQFFARARSASAISRGIRQGNALSAGTDIGE